MPLTCTIECAVGAEFARCREMLVRHHYLRTFPDPRGMPLTYAVRLDGAWVGTLVFGRPESNRCYRGEMTYGSTADRDAGKCRFDRWEVLNLARVWLDPCVQPGGHLCRPDALPGFADRKGRWRPAFASHVVRAAIWAVRYDYLMLYPPCWVEEPYQIRAVLSYCDTRVHRGVIYRASGFALAGANREGIETWYTVDVPPLDPERDAAVRLASRLDGRSASKRAARRRAVAQGDLFAAAVFEGGSADEARAEAAPIACRESPT